MATFITWSGATNGVLSTTSNWIGGVVPGAAEWALFPASVTNPPSSSMSGLSNSLGGVLVAPGAAYDVGGSGDPLKVVASEWKHYGSGKLWMDVDSIATACEIVIDCRPGGNADIAGSFSGAMTVRIIRGGTAEAPVDISATFGAATVIDVGYRNAADSDSYLSIATGAGTAALVNLWGGQAIAYNAITAANVLGGWLRTMGSSATGTLRVGPFGRAEYFSTGTLTLASVAGRIGFLKQGTQQTVTDMVLYPGATADYDMDLLTITNGLNDLRRA